MSQVSAGVRSEGSAPSMQDVADRAGVAIGTVSNVLNRPHLVSERTTRKVETAIAALGFVRNSAARSLAAGSSNTVGLVLVDLENSFFVDIARGVESATARAGLKLLLANSDVDQSRQADYLEHFDEARSAGLILAPLDGPLDGAHTVRSHGRPIVLVNAPVPDQKLCSVVVDDRVGGELATQHLIDQGCRHLAFLAGPLQFQAVKKRLAGARNAAKRASVPLTVVEADTLKAPSGRAAAMELLAQTDLIDGIVCCSDPQAVGVIGAALDLGMAVPGDLAVIGYDDNHFAADSIISVSTIGGAGVRMGEIAAELLLDEINDPDHHRHRSVVVEPRLLPRRSSQRTPS
jgi:LacI family transcriptional regulator